MPSKLLDPKSVQNLELFEGALKKMYHTLKGFPMQRPPLVQIAGGHLNR
jgi:hypothetical protein